MNNRVFVSIVGLLSCVTAACGSSSHTGAAAMSNGSRGGASGDSGASGKTYQELVSYDWTLQPGEEKYWCIYRTLTEDLIISAFKPLLPLGTHHVVIGYNPTPTEPDGTWAEGENGCTGTTFGDIYSYVGTVGGQTMPMPDGVAVKIPSGSQLVFGLHVNDLGADPLSGHSGVEISVPKPSEVAHEAEVFAVSDFQLSIPPGKVAQTADCTLLDDATIFAVMPHMHLMGKHMTVTSVTAGGGKGPTLLNADYTFTEQQYTPLPSLQFARGDKIHLECDYENTGSNTLTFGENTVRGEMCIAFAYRYPAVNMNHVANVGAFARGLCEDPPPDAGM